MSDYLWGTAGMLGYNPARRVMTEMETQMKSKKDSSKSNNSESKVVVKERDWISIPGRNSEASDEEPERDDRGREINTHSTL